MERFVQLIVVGGLVLVGALWAVSFLDPWSVAWLAGVVLALLGVGGLSAGISSEIETP